MSNLGKSQGMLWRLVLVIGLVFTSVVSVRSWAFAQSTFGPLSIVRSLATSEFGAREPKGLAFSTAANTFLLLDGAGNITSVTMGEELAGKAVLPEAQDNALNAAFDDRTSSLFILDRRKSELAKIQANDKGLPDVALQARSDVKALNLKDPQGLAFDSQNGLLFVLDAANAQIVSVAAHPTLGFEASEALRANQVRDISLANLGVGTFKGLAFNPSNGHLYVSELQQKKLYELDQAGALVSTFALASVGINSPAAMTYAPSVDNTDDPNIYNLFVLDAGTPPTGSQLVELSLQAPMALPPGTTLLPASLVQIIDTSAWNPPSPDPAGVDYLPSPVDKLIVVDSEVDEMSIFTGKNEYFSTTAGNLTDSCDTMDFTNEPTGVGVNPSNNHIFVSTDMNDRIFEIIDWGTDGICGTPDDTVTTTNVSSIGATDAEDVAYGNNTLFIADGVNAEVYVIPLGNGLLDAGDLASATHFDTLALGFTDLEGIGFNPDSNPDTIFIISTKGTEKYLGETTTAGTLLRAYDLTFMGAGGNKRSDLTYAPSSQGGGRSIYIASRNVDNNSNPNENDGQIWEVDISGSGPTPTPTTTPPTGDLIFADGFETADVDFVPPWSISKTDSGDLSISPAAALVGSKGMQALIDDTVTIFVTSDHPNAEPRYRARFYFDPNSITMASGNAHFIFHGIMGTSAQVLRIEFRFSSGVYQIRGRLINDAGTWLNTSWFTITDAPHSIELDWRAASGAGANDGGLTLWIDGTQQADLTGVDNDTKQIDRARLGAVAGIDAGTTGTYYFDAFESRRQNMIGP